MAEDDFTASTAVDEGSSGVQEHGVGLYAQMAVIGTILSALGYAVADAILSTGSLFLAPLRAIAEGLATFFGGTLLAPTRVVDAGATSSAESFLTGTGALLGPFAFPVAVLSAIAGIYLLYRFIVAVGVSPTRWFTENDG